MEVQTPLPCVTQLVRDGASMNAGVCRREPVSPLLAGMGGVIPFPLPTSLHFRSQFQDVVACGYIDLPLL